MGHLVHVGLTLAKQIVFFREEADWVESCRHVETLIFNAMQPLFIFLQLYMIFKYSNVSEPISNV